MENVYEFCHTLHICVCKCDMAVSAKLASELFDYDEKTSLLQQYLKL